jgi:hypothetical protein
VVALDTDRAVIHDLKGARDAYYVVRIDTLARNEEPEDAESSEEQGPSKRCRCCR